MNILRTENLKVYFHQRRRVVKALDGVDIFLPRGVTTALAGESGCGKTTLAKAVLGFHKPYQGKIYFENQDITLRKNEQVIRKNIQIVFQNPFLSVDSRYTVFSTLYETLRVFKNVSKSEAKGIIENTLRDVELKPDIMQRYPHQLSGGQVQRLCIARSLINHPPLVILDEPTSSLDITTASKIVKLLQKLQESKGITALFISHNLKLIKKISQFSFIMYYGKIMEYGPTDLIYNKPAHPYTKLLKQAADLKLRSLKEVEIPEKGCPFLGRCGFKTDKCLEECVKKEVEPGHFVFCHQITEDGRLMTDDRN
jgi:oligopeptide/dipeptide ABC transporter ATP-binding protein